jgi:hypothetical protein
MKKTILVLSCAAAMTASPAFAATSILSSDAGTSSNYGSPAGATTVVDFNSGNTAAGFVASVTGTNVGRFTGTVFNANNSGNDYFRPEPTDNSAYYGVGRNSTFQLLGTVAQASVSVFVGSLDAYNVITLLDATGMTIGNYTGTQIAGFVPPFPGTTQPSSNRRVTFGADGNTPIYGIRFSNSDNLGSFEFDNVAFTAAVPEPATWAMMMLGFAMVGAAARYRRRSTNVRFA